MVDKRGEELQVRESAGEAEKVGDPGPPGINRLKNSFFCAPAGGDHKAEIESIKGIICEEYVYQAPRASLKVKCRSPG